MASSTDSRFMLGGTPVAALYMGQTPVWHPKIQWLQDTFDVSDTARWEFNDPSAVRIINGQFETDRTTGWTGYAWTRQYFDIRESSVSIQIVSLATPVTNMYQGLEFGVSSPTPGISLAIDVENNNALTLWGPAGQIGQSAAYSFATMSWLRIRGSGGTLYADTSSNGTTWTNRFSWQPTFDISAVSLYIGSGGDVGGSKYVFDNLNVPPA